MCIRDSLHAANLELFPDISSENLQSSIKKAIQYWNCVAENLNTWNLAKSNDLPPSERKEYVNFSAIVLKCLGIIGNQLLEQKSYKRTLKKLNKIDWRRTNKENWEGRCINQGRMMHNNVAALLTVATIKKHLELPLTPKEKAEEIKFKGANND